MGRTKAAITGHHHTPQVHGSRGNLTPEWRHTYVTAFRHQDMVAYERQRGFRHSYRDTEALQTLRRTKAEEARTAILCVDGV